MAVPSKACWQPIRRGNKFNESLSASKDHAEPVLRNYPTVQLVEAEALCCEFACLADTWTNKEVAIPWIDEQVAQLDESSGRLMHLVSGDRAEPPRLICGMVRDDDREQRSSSP